MVNPTDMSEAGLERLIVETLTGQRAGGPTAAQEGGFQRETGYLGEQFYVQGDPKDYDRDHAVDLVQLMAFLRITQPDVFDALGIAAEGPSRTRFLHRLQGEIAKRGVIEVLRKGISHGPQRVTLYYGVPTPGNPQAKERFEQNIFSVTRQLRYSPDGRQYALDLAIFINGLPVITFELKNNVTKQTVEDAIEQYKRDREPRELLFQFGRCIVHFAVDDKEVWMCTELKGKQSWFLPFNKGWKDGAGNPPIPEGLATDYLWKEVLKRENLANIIENYAQVVEEEDAQGRARRKQIFPRYHQLTVVRELLADARVNGAGKRYLIQHSAGSGKSNSIAWLAHQVYAPSAIDSFVLLYLGGADREQLDPILDGCVATYVADLDEDRQVDFKGKAKAFLRTYNFLSTVLPYGMPEWEKLSIFLNFLVPKLPAPPEDDLTNQKKAG